MPGIADEQRLVGRHPQQRLQMRVEFAGDVIRISELHGVVTKQPAHNPFVKTLAGAFLLGLQGKRNFAAAPLLNNERFTFDQIIEMLGVAVADDIAGETEKLAAVALDRLDAEPAPQIQFGADVGVLLRHERHPAIVLAAFRVADPVIASGISSGSPFSFL